MESPSARSCEPVSIDRSVQTRGGAGRRAGLVPIVVTVSILVVGCLVAASVFASWAPLFHSACSRRGSAATIENMFIPAVLVNAPYGGQAWGNGTVPSTFPGAWNGAPPPGVYAVAFGIGAINGQAQGAYFSVNLSVTHVSNATLLGPGPSEHCTDSMVVTLEPPLTHALASGYIMGENNTSDVSEPNIAGLPGGLASPIKHVLFNNSFSAANQKEVSTCGTASISLPLVSVSILRVLFQIQVGNLNYTLPYVLPIEQTFHYTFPADFGSWEVDNLSARGGPGGGWAFSYSPCP